MSVVVPGNFWEISKFTQPKSTPRERHGAPAQQTSHDEEAPAEVGIEVADDAEKYTNPKDHAAKGCCPPRAVLDVDQEAPIGVRCPCLLARKGFGSTHLHALTLSVSATLAGRGNEPPRLESGRNTAGENEEYREASQGEAKPRGRRNPQNCQCWGDKKWDDEQRRPNQKRNDARQSWEATPAKPAGDKC